MIKLTRLVALFCVVLVHSASAQFVTIPDVNFRNELKDKYPSCFNASNQLDTVCAGNTAITGLSVTYRQIANLEGIRYFKKLKVLDCSRNQLTSLPALPSSLTDLRCFKNQLTSLPTLPSSLTELECSRNQLTSLPTLPSSLTELICSQNQLTSLPMLPNALRLHCDTNQLTSLPALSSSLTYLLCSSNQLTSLPTLPNTLQILECSRNTQLSCLPFLPSSINNLRTNNTNIVCLPNKPQGISSNPLPICNSTNNPNQCAVIASVKNKETKSLKIYPNPLEGEMLTIPNMRGSSAKLLTLTGQELRSWTNIGEQISLQNVAAGMYLLEVSQNGQRRTAKVVVK